MLLWSSLWTGLLFNSFCDWWPLTTHDFKVREYCTWVSCNLSVDSNLSSYNIATALEKIVEVTCWERPLHSAPAASAIDDPVPNLDGAVWILLAFKIVSGRPRPYTTPPVRKWEMNLNWKSSVGEASVSAVRNLEVVRYWGAVNELSLWEFQLVHHGLSVIR